MTAGRCLENGGKVRKTDSHKYMKVLLAFTKKATKYEPINSCVCGKSVRFLNERPVFIRIKVQFRGLKRWLYVKISVVCLVCKVHCQIF